MKRQAMHHTKLDDLMRFLKLPRWGAVGILESLWHLAAREAPRGDIGKLSNRSISVAIGWTGDHDRLVDALVDARWIDLDGTYRLLIHDWPDHADESVKKFLKRNGLSWACTGHVSDMSRQNLDMSSLPVPEPVPVPIPEPMPTAKPSLPQWKLDELFTDLIAAAKTWGAAVVDEDAGNCFPRWCKMSGEQRVQALETLHNRISAGDDPKFFSLQRLCDPSTGDYHRPVVQRRNGNGKRSVLAALED